MRKAVIAGIDYYTVMPLLFGCVTDARAVMSALARHADGSVNFDIKPLLGAAPQQAVSRDRLREMVHWLFSGPAEIALFYFAGHGHMEPFGGYLCASDCRTGFDGLALSELVTLANQSQADNRIVILDSCHSGAAGVTASGLPGRQETVLTEGTTILTASTAAQCVRESGGMGVFTSQLVEALHGAGGNLRGDVTPAAVHEHISRSLGPRGQQPIFRTNVKSCVSLRRVGVPPGLRPISAQLDRAGLPRRPEAAVDPGAAAVRPRARRRTGVRGGKPRAAQPAPPPADSRS